MIEDLMHPHPTGRSHFYVFVHEALPSVLFRDREKLVDYLRGPNAQSGLDTLWRDVGTVVVERGIGASLPSSGLTAEAVDGSGWRGVVIHMPRVEELGECSLILTVVPNDPATGGLWDLYEEKGAPLARLFMLKLLQLPQRDKPEFLICELSPLIGEVTTGYTCAGSAIDFVREVVDRLDVE